MPSFVLTFRRGLIAAVLVLLALSLLPHRYTGYGVVVRSITELPLRLAADPLGSVAASLRRREDAPVLGDNKAQLSQQILTLQGEVAALRQRERQLERAVAELQGLRRRLGETYELRLASVVSRRSGGAGAAGTLQLNVGTRDGIHEGMAVVDGPSVVGRITQAAPTSSVLRVLTSTGTLLEVMALPAGADAEELEQRRRGRFLLESAGPRRLAAYEVDERLAVGAGDFARLMDDRWPQAVQGMIVGQVVAVEDDPDDPLLKRVGVRPLVSLQDLDEVTVIVPRAPSPEQQAASGGEGRR